MPKLALMGYFDVGTLEKEMERLYSEGVPDFFVCEYAAEVEDSERIEEEVRQKFANDFVLLERGFFKKESIEPIKIIIKKYEIKDVTLNHFQLNKGNKQETRKNLNLNFGRKRGPNFTFEEVGIKKGNVLVFHNDEEIECFVYDNKTKVILVEEGEPNLLALSTAAEKICKEKNEITKSGTYQGVRYWKHQGELLVDLWEKSKIQ